MNPYKNPNVVSALGASPSCDTSGADFKRDSVFKPMIACELTWTHGAEALTFLRKYHTLIDSQYSKLEVAKHFEHTIDTGNAGPYHQRPYRVSSSQRETIEGEIVLMMHKGFVQPSSSSGSFALFV